MQLGQNISIGVYWQRVLALAAELPRVVTLISIEDARTGAVGGVICDALNTDMDRTAAKLLFAGSHRIATAKEIAEYEAAQSKMRAHYANVERERKQQNLTLPPEINNMLELVLRQSRAKDDEKETGAASGQAKKQG